jgi:hypothetical protein
MDMHGGKTLEAEVRASYTVEQTLDKLLKNAFISPLQPGQEYVLMLRRENRRLLPQQTLREAGVVDGDLLQAGAIMRGG